MDSQHYAERLWVTVGELQAKTANNQAYKAVQRWAGLSGSPVLSDRNDDGDVALLAATYVAIKRSDNVAMAELRSRTRAAMGTELALPDGKGNGESLALARNLPAVLIAAKLLGLDKDAELRRWASTLSEQRLGLQRRSLVSTHEDRANNWGTHAGAARIALALFLRDAQELERAALVFRGWLGDRNAYRGFNFGKDQSWQVDVTAPRGINPAGGRIRGHNVDGVLPDDQRRGGAFSWPPAKENYVWEALQGAVLQAQLLTDNGYCAFEWQDRAILRAVTWLIETANYLPEGDDIWLLPIIDRAYGTSFATRVRLNSGRPGKSIGFTAFSHPTHRKGPYQPAECAEYPSKSGPSC